MVGKMKGKASAMSVLAVYVVTYRKPDVLAENLRSLYAGLSGEHEVRVTVLSNSAEVSVPDDLPAQPRVLVNSTRPENAWGYLARDWNWALLDAFRTWRGTDVDWAVLAQDDVTWLPGWDSRLVAVDSADFLTQPRGDQVMAFRLDAVLKVGFFDERFCTLHFHEQDYFCRAILGLGARASITDDHEGYEDTGSWNPLGQILIPASHSGYNDVDERFHTRKTYRELRSLILNKWGATRIEQFMDRRAFSDGVAAGLITWPRELDLYPFFWDGFIGQRRLDPVYSPPAPRFGTSVLVLGGSGGEGLLVALQKVADDMGEGDYEVLISCQSTPENRQLRRALEGDVFFFMEEQVDRERALHTLRTNASSENHVIVEVARS